MAFQLPYTASISTSAFPEAYALLTHVAASVPSSDMDCEFKVYADKASFDAGCPPIAEFSRVVDLLDGTMMLDAVMQTVGTALQAGNIPELSGAIVVP